MQVILSCFGNLIFWFIAVGYWFLFRRGKPFYESLSSGYGESLSQIGSDSDRGWQSFLLDNLGLIIKITLLGWFIGLSLTISTVIVWKNVIALPVMFFATINLAVIVLILGIAKITSPSNTFYEAPDFNNAKITKYTIILPKGSEWDSERATNFIQQLALLCKWIELRIEADAEGITWYLVDYSDTLSASVKRIVYSSYPNAFVVSRSQQNSLEEVFYRGINQYPFIRSQAFYSLKNSFVASLKIIRDEGDNDPLGLLVEAMAGLRPGERICYALLLFGDAPDAYARGEAEITQSAIHPLQMLSRYGIDLAVALHLSGQNRVKRFAYRDQTAFEDKLRQPLLNAALMVEIDSPDIGRVEELKLAVQSQLGLYMNPPYNNLVCIPLEKTLIQNDDENWRCSHNARWLSSSRLILEPRELAALWHLPHNEMKTQGIVWEKKVLSVPMPLQKNTEGVYLGEGKFEHGRIGEVRLPYSDRATHISIIGKTGMGKSTLLHRLIHQDIANGYGVAVIDPHGKLIQEILGYSIPPERENDLILLDLAEKDYPPPLNPINLSRRRSTLSVIGLIERLFPETEVRARLSQTLRVTLQLLAYDENATLRDATRLLQDDVYRGALLAKCKDIEIREYWKMQFHNEKSYRTDVIEPIINRIRPFYGNPYLYPVVCHPDTLDIDSFIREKKIVLVSLDMDEELVPNQEREMLGTLLLSRLQIAGMKKENQENQQTFFVYVDEVQRFRTSSLDTMFSEARKFRTSLTVSHQYLDQLDDSLMNSILGNVGTNIIFRSNPNDTSKLALHMQPEYSREELVGLDQFEAAVKMQYQNRTQPAFTLFTPQPLGYDKEYTKAFNALERANKLRRDAKANMKMKTRDEIEALLKKRYQEEDDPVAPQGVPPKDNVSKFVEPSND